MQGRVAVRLLVEGSGAVLPPQQTNSRACVSSLIIQLCRENRPEEAWRALLSLGHSHDALQHRDIVYHLLQGCLHKQDLFLARNCLSLIISNGMDASTLFSDHLIMIFACCGSLPEATQVFSRIIHPSIYTWNAIISAHVKLGEHQKALHLYAVMQKESRVTDKFTVLSVLKACGSIHTIQEGRLVHFQLVMMELLNDVAVRTALICMYKECRSLADAHAVFDVSANRNLALWGAMISGYAEEGNQLALELFEKMQEEGIEPDQGIFLSVLQVCCLTSNIKQGRLIHAQIKRSHATSDCIVGSALINMYANCGIIDEAFQVFYCLPNPDVVTWTAMMSACIQHGLGMHALELYVGFLTYDIKPDKVVFLCVSKACTLLGALHQGRLVHSEVITAGLEINVMIGNSLIDMYAKCSSLDEALHIFDRLPTRDLVSWDTLISGYALSGNGIAAIEKFKAMSFAGLKSSPATFIGLLKACATTGSIVSGNLIHDKLFREGLEGDTMVVSALLDMYVTCGRLDDASKIFQNLKDQDQVSLSIMMTGYTESGLGLLALNMFDQMRHQSLVPDKVTFISATKACGTIADPVRGRLLHDLIIQHGLELGVNIGNSLIDLYGKCGKLNEALAVFECLQTRNAISWGTLIGAYVQHGHSHLALEVFEEMQQLGASPDQATLVCVVQACANEVARQEGMFIHDQVLRSEFAQDGMVGNALVNMYSKFGSIEQARKEFDNMLFKDVVSWGTMIACYTQQGHGVAALELYRQMIAQQNLQPTKAMFLCMLKVCLSLGALEQGKLIHGQIKSYSLELDLAIGNSLIDFYSKCGNLEEALDVFGKLTNRDVVSWAILILGYALHGQFEQVVESLKAMQKAGLNPDRSLFTTVLNACGIARRPKDACFYLKSMVEDCGIDPDFEVYSCMVDVLGQSGLVYEALDLAQAMPDPPDDGVCMSLLTNCRTYGHPEVGKLTFELSPNSDSGCILLPKTSVDLNDINNGQGFEDLEKSEIFLTKPEKACIKYTEVYNKLSDIVSGGSLSTCVL